MDWSKIKYFSQGEWKKDPSKVHPRLVEILDEIREKSLIPIHIHVAYDNNGHASKSYHYRNPSLAVDFHFSPEIPFLNQIQFLLEYDEINGIGFYGPKEWMHPGWHCDLRNPPRLFWERIGGKYHYYTDKQEFIKKVERYDS